MAVKAEEEAWKGRDAHGLETYSQNRTATRHGNGPEGEEGPRAAWVAQAPGCMWVLYIKMGTSREERV